MANKELSLEQFRVLAREQKARAEKCRLGHLVFSPRGERLRSERREYLELAIRAYQQVHPKSTAEKSYRKLESYGLKNLDCLKTTDLGELGSQLRELPYARMRQSARNRANLDRIAELMRKLLEVKPTRYKKTAKAVAAFTARLDMMAKEITIFMADPIYVPDRKFLNLPKPNTLRRYAEHVRERYRLVQQSRKGRPLPRAELYRCLRATLWEHTGEECLNDLKNLLLAVEFLARRTPNNPYPRATNFKAHLKTNAQRYPAPSFLRKR